MGELLLITSFVLGCSNPFLNTWFELCEAKAGEEEATPNGGVVTEQGARGVGLSDFCRTRADGKPIPSSHWNNPAGLANTNYKHFQIPNRSQCSERCSSSSVEKTRNFISVGFTCGLKEVTQAVWN